VQIQIKIAKTLKKMANMNPLDVKAPRKSSSPIVSGVAASVTIADDPK
jgi:hypothetical protein